CNFALLKERDRVHIHRPTRWMWEMIQHSLDSVKGAPHYYVLLLFRGDPGDESRSRTDHLDLGPDCSRVASELPHELVRLHRAVVVRCATNQVANHSHEWWIPELLPEPDLVLIELLDIVSRGGLQYVMVR